MQRLQANFAHILFLVLAIATALVFQKIPFFWDMVNNARLATFYYENGFTFSLPEELDYGHPPLFPLIIACCWSIFGKTLLISHLLSAIISALLFSSAWELCRHFASLGTSCIFIVLLLCDTTFSAQSLLMGIDILMCAIYLLAVLGIIKNKKLLLVLSSCLLVMMSIRGGVLIFALYLQYVISIYGVENSLVKSIRSSIIFLPVLLTGIIWYGLHYKYTGWVASAPLQYEFRQVPSFSSILKNCIIFDWRLLDFGRVVLPIPIAFVLLRSRLDAQKKELLLLFVIPYFVLFLSMIVLSNPIGHKYLLVPILLLYLTATVFIFESVIKPLLRYIVLSCIVISQLLSNFWIYPARYANGWDSSLKVLPYFSLLEEVKDYCDSLAIPREQVGTDFPMFSEPAFTTLKSDEKAFSNKQNRYYYRYRYILISNVDNNPHVEQQTQIKSGWKPLLVKRSGLVTMELFENPLQNIQDPLP